MNWNNYVIRVERHSHHHRDDWGVEYDSYDYYDADIKDIKAGNILTLMEYFGEDRPQRADIHIRLKCVSVNGDSLDFTFQFLENQEGTSINVKPNEPAFAGGSSDRHSASYTISLIPKSEYQPKKGDITYK